MGHSVPGCEEVLELLGERSLGHPFGVQALAQTSEFLLVEKREGNRQFRHRELLVNYGAIPKGSSGPSSAWSYLNRTLPSGPISTRPMIRAGMPTRIA